MNLISFNTANFVAREVGYCMPSGWGQGDGAANDWFRPLNTFGERFDAMLNEISSLGFTAVDLWAAHLNYSWATPEHIAIAQSALVSHRLTVTSYSSAGRSLPELRAACRLCNLLGTGIIGAGSPLLASDRSEFVNTLRQFEVVFGYENHPEKSASEILTKIGESDEDVIGVTVDTGWFGTQNFNGPGALRKLAPRLKLVHLKDVKARRDVPSGFPMIDMGHETCRYGAGIVDIRACVDALKEIGYVGTISVEHEPEDFDPSEDVVASKRMLEEWLVS